MTHRDIRSERPAVDRLDLATDALRATPIPAGPSPELMAATMAALQVSSELQQSTDIVRLQERRKLMFRIARYGGVTSAMILLLCVLGWFLSGQSGSMAFADVMQKIQQANNVTLQQRQKLGQQPEISVKVLMQGAAVRIEFPEAQVVVYDLSKRRGVDATPFGKRIDVHHFDLTEQLVKQIPNLLDALRKSKEQSVERLGEETVGGRKQEIFRLKKFHPLIGEGQSDLKLWADTETGLPSKMESRWKDPADGTESYVIMEEFHWNTKLEASLFDLDHPNVDCLKPALLRSVPINHAKHVLPVGTNEVRLSGQVLTPDGKPQAGAKVYASGIEISKDWTSPVTVLATTDGLGRFTASLKLPFPEAIERVILSATHESFGLAGVGLSRIEKLDDITLRLIKEGPPIQGRVVDSNAKAIAGASIRIVGLSQPSKKTLERVTASTKVVPTVTTDAEGRFLLKGLGEGRIATLEIEGMGIERRQIQVATSPEAKSGQILDPVFEYKATPGRTIKGRIVDASTRAPLRDVQITISTAAGMCFTDAKGEFEFTGAPRHDKYGVMALPARDEPYFIGSQSVTSPPGDEPITMELGLTRGIVFSGRVLDDETGRPVQAQLGYFPLYPNPNLKPEMGYGAAGGGGATSEAHTMWGESFSIVVLPGPGALGIRATTEDRYENVRVDPFEFFKRGEYGGDKKSMSRGNVLLKQEQGPSAVSGLVQDQYNAIILLNPEPGQADIQRDIRLKPRKP